MLIILCNTGFFVRTGKKDCWNTDVLIWEWYGLCWSRCLPWSCLNCIWYFVWNTDRPSCISWPDDSVQLFHSPPRPLWIRAQTRQWSKRYTYPNICIRCPVCFNYVIFWSHWSYWQWWVWYWCKAYVLSASGTNRTGHSCYVIWMRNDPGNNRCIFRIWNISGL